MSKPSLPNGAESETYKEIRISWLLKIKQITKGISPSYLENPYKLANVHKKINKTEYLYMMNTSTSKKSVFTNVFLVRYSESLSKIFPIKHLKINECFITCKNIVKCRVHNY